MTVPVFLDFGLNSGRYYRFRTRERVTRDWYTALCDWCRENRVENAKWIVDHSGVDEEPDVYLYVNPPDENQAMAFKLRWC